MSKYDPDLSEWEFKPSKAPIQPITNPHQTLTATKEGDYYVIRCTASADVYTLVSFSGSGALRVRENDGEFEPFGELIGGKQDSHLTIAFFLSSGPTVYTFAVRSPGRNLTLTCSSELNTIIDSNSVYDVYAWPRLKVSQHVYAIASSECESGGNVWAKCDIDGKHREHYDNAWNTALKFDTDLRATPSIHAWPDNNGTKQRVFTFKMKPRPF